MLQRLEVVCARHLPRLVKPVGQAAFGYAHREKIGEALQACDTTTRCFFSVGVATDACRPVGSLLERLTEADSKVHEWRVIAPTAGTRHS